MGLGGKVTTPRRAAACSQSRLPRDDLRPVASDPCRCAGKNNRVTGQLCTVATEPRENTQGSGPPPPEVRRIQRK
ncbi:hypothetical protein SKAU_G00247600 [Synaphobranchus kaupii]|uniref:Uncharacterized protein n=1 Tax=Synaphobranchus kaupii TaxID=118154 RepID=A0A9Q1F2G8_SYNKA|nr:hypothetical protein SKAU_G00247600 [Synaphobranchus kaupii]